MIIFFLFFQKNSNFTKEEWEKLRDSINNKTSTNDTKTENTTENLGSENTQGGEERKEDL